MLFSLLVSYLCLNFTHAEALAEPDRNSVESEHNQIAKTRENQLNQTESSAIKQAITNPLENKLSEDNSAENESAETDSTIKLEAQKGIQQQASTEENQVNDSKTIKSDWQFLHQYQASYLVFSENDKLGIATRSLVKSDSGWKLQMSTKIKKWMLSLKSNEYSEFNIDDFKLRPSRFFTSTKVTFKSARVIEQQFDWDKKTEYGKRDQLDWNITLEGEILDRMSHILKLRADLIKQKTELEYQVSYKGSIKNYRYEIKAEEKLETKLGKLKVIKVDRVKGDDSSFSLWLSPAHNFLPVKIAQIEQDKPDVVMIINAFDYLAKDRELLSENVASENID